MRILENIVRRALNEQINHPMRLTKKVKVSDNLKYHLDNKISLDENVYRVYSKSFIDLINEVRELFYNGCIDLNENDITLIESDLGKSVILENGEKVYLEVPIKNTEFISEAEYQGRKVQLGKPFLTPNGPKKRSVYVKNEKGNVVKVNFGDPNMRIKKNIPSRRKSFRARHNCQNPGPKYKSRYWSCKAW
jgi:hypothetical protein